MNFGRHRKRKKKREDKRSEERREPEERRDQEGRAYEKKKGTGETGHLREMKRVVVLRRVWCP